MKKIYCYLPVLCMAASAAIAGEFREKAFLLSRNMAVPGNLPEMKRLIDAAADASYNVVYLRDSKFTGVRLQDRNYLANVKQIADHARNRSMKVILGIAPVGDVNMHLRFNPNFAEAAPVENAPYIVRGGRLVPGEDLLRNVKSAAWLMKNRENIVYCAEEGSFRMTGGKKKEYRISLPLTVKPFQHYRFSCLIRTEGVPRNNGINLFVDGGMPDGTRVSLNYRHLTKWDRIGMTQKYIRYSITFNTLECRSITLYAGAWNLGEGIVRFKDFKLEPAGFINVVRRDTTPVIVTLQDGKTVCREGVDFQRIEDPRLGSSPRKGLFNDRHDAPEIQIPSGSRLKEGDRILVSYHHALLSQKSALFCLSRPEFMELMKDDIRRLQTAVRPDGWLLNIDEVRAYGYDPDCVKSGKNAGEALACCVRELHGFLRKISPDSAVYMWNDMFCPYHNAQPGRYYYFVRGRGSLAPSPDSLPKDIIIVNWLNSSDSAMRSSIRHFTQQGHWSIICPGYFDSFKPDLTAKLLALGKEEKGVIGFAYVTWTRNYKYLKSVSDLAAEQ